MVFCVALSASERFFLSYQKPFLGNNLNFSSFGDLGGGQKMTRHGKKGHKIFQKKVLKSRGKKEQEMGGISHVITFGVFSFK